MLLAGAADDDGVELPPAAPKRPPAGVPAPPAPGFAPKRLLPPLGAPDAPCPPKRLEVGAAFVVCAVEGGLELSVGGAPAGVVDASENAGFAGVAVAVVVSAPA